MALAHIEFEGGGRTDFHVSSFSGYNAISRLYRYEIDLFCTDPSVNMEDMLTQPAWLGLRQRAQSGTGTILLKIHGVISSFQQLEQQTYGVHYRATLVPRLWRRSLEQQSQVYQNKTIPQIVEEELERSRR